MIGPVWFSDWELIFTILGNNITFNLRLNTGKTPHENTYQLSLFKLLPLRHPFFVIKVLLTIAFFVDLERHHKNRKNLNSQEESTTQ